LIVLEQSSSGSSHCYSYCIGGRPSERPC